MTNYITLAEVKNYLKINSVDHDSRLANLITYGCSVVESYCGRQFASNTYTEVFEGGTSSVFIKNTPINNVHQVLEYDGSQYQVLDGPSPTADNIELTKQSKAITAYPGFSLQDRYVKFGISSAQFNGTSGYLSVADDEDFWLDTLPFTIEAWIRVNTLSRAQTIVSQVQDQNNYWSFSYNNTQGLTFEAVSGATQVAFVTHASLAGYTANQFVHVCVSRDSNSNLRLFRHGTELANVACSNSIPNLSSSVEIGRQSLVDNQWFSGQMDELRMSLNVDRFASPFTPQGYAYSSDKSTTLLLHFNGARGATSTQDSSRAREQYTWYDETGEITRYVGEDAGNKGLTILGIPRFNNYTRGVKVTYNGGYDQVPADIKLATIDYVKELHKGLESRSVSLQGESMVAFDLSGGFAPHIRRVLDLYRTIM